MEAGGRVIGDWAQGDLPRTEAPSGRPDCNDDQHFALIAAPAALDRIVVAAASDFGLIDLDQAGQRAATWGEHAAAQLGEDRSRLSVGTQMS
jgi:hypothetical protein